VKRRLVIGSVVVVVVAIGVMSWRLKTSSAGVLSSDRSAVPTTRVVRGPLELGVHTTGELRASRSVTLQAPPVGGGMLRLLTLLETGTAVKADDVVMEFDPTEQQYALEQAQSQVAEAEQQIVKLKADRDAQTAQDRVDLLTAQFDLRRAVLDAKVDQDLVSASEFQKRALSLDEAQRKLAQVEDGAKTRADTNRASLAVAEEARTRANLAAVRAQQNIASLTVKATMDGFVVARDNRDANGGFFYSGMSLPEYRAGDSVFPGRPIADVFDVSQMEIRAKVNEQQRNNVASGQPATVESAAQPDARLSAKVVSVSGLAQSDFWGSSGPLRDFDVTLRLDQTDARLLPGTTVRLALAGTRVENVLHVPRQAIFEKDGKPIVFLRVADRFEPRPVKPVQRTENRVAIEGLPEGAEVALVNPEAVTKNKGPNTPATAGVQK
jgi:multidrug efflux pump subunit AcrA (membrane-fusion protein)